MRGGVNKLKIHSRGLQKTSQEVSATDVAVPPLTVIRCSPLLVNPLYIQPLQGVDLLLGYLVTAPLCYFAPWTTSLR